MGRGGAIGDGLGLATEFMYKEQARIMYGNGPIKFGNSEGHPFWRDAARNGWFDNDFTDDTDQMILIAQCLLDNGGTVNPVHLAYRIREWCKVGLPELDNKLPNGIGFTVGSSCAHPEHPTNPLRAAYEVWNRNKRNLAANGSLMRTGVVGIPFFWNEDKVVENAMMAAKTTHTDPRSVTGAVIVSVLISRLLRGSLKSNIEKSDENSRFIEMLQYGSKEGDDSYLEKFKMFPKPIPKPLNTPIHRTLLREVRKVAARLVGQPLNPLFEHDFSIPTHEPVDLQRFQNPVPLRPDVKHIDEFGSDEEMMDLCKDVVDRYNFLVADNPFCPPPEEIEEGKPTWTEELYAHAFPASIDSLKLNERAKIGYSLKCLGAGLYLGTRKKPEDMTSAQFFDTLITQLLLETGDSDTNCAVAGAVLGCRLIKSGLPDGWVEGIRHRDFLEKLGDDLCKLIWDSINENQ